MVEAGALRAVAPGLPLGGRVSGTVALSGAPDRAPLALDVRLEMGTGLATVAGTLDLTGAVPRYDVTGRLVGIELQSGGGRSRATPSPWWPTYREARSGWTRWLRPWPRPT